MQILEQSFEEMKGILIIQTSEDLEKYTLLKYMSCISSILYVQSRRNAGCKICLLPPFLLENAVMTRKCCFSDACHFDCCWPF